MQPLADNSDLILDALLNPLKAARRPIMMAGFGLHAIRSAKGVVNALFNEQHARGLFAGIAAHSFLRLDQMPSASLGVMLGLLGHAAGWPMPRGGSQKIPDAMAAHFRSLGGEIITGQPVESIDDLPAADAVLFDVTPRQLIKIAGHRFPDGYRRRLSRFRYGPGTFKMDFALDGPIPWTAPGCSQAGTVHLGGRSRRLPTRSTASCKATTRTGHLCCLPSRVFLMRLVPRKASTLSGPTATCQTARL
jgi:phytoene dehydrogenase-like protein